MSDYRIMHASSSGNVIQVLPDFEIAASVIVAVYNKKPFLKDCIKCLDDQTLQTAQFEAIFIDDGSTDGSLEELKKLAEARSWIRIISKDNGGVCSARNAGIRAARGRYLFFLDPDDSFSRNTLERVSAFFDRHYDETDLVTYLITPYVNGTKRERHFRFKYLKESGVYDLEHAQNYLVCQTTMNVCVKNRFENNNTFDFESTNGIIYHEDQQYITEVLMKKMTLGFCNEAEYIWNKNTESTTTTMVKSVLIYDNTLNMYEHLYQLSGGTPSRYVQALLIHDIGWKMASGASLPVHLKGTAYHQALNRLGKLLEKVEDSIIMTHPSMHPYHRFFFLELKNGGPLQLSCKMDRMAILRNGEEVYTENSIELLAIRTRVVGSACRLWGVIKSPALRYASAPPRLFCAVTENGHETINEIEVRPSSYGIIGCHSEVATFYDYQIDIDIERECTWIFSVQVEGIDYPTRLAALKAHTFFDAAREFVATINNRRVRMDRAAGAIIVSSDNVFASKPEKLDSSVLQEIRSAIQSTITVKQNENERIWVYSDSAGVLDNAWIQFCHDAPKRDGVKRYYAAHDVEPGKFKSSERAQIVSFGSTIHKVVHICADKRLVSDLAATNASPWNHEEHLHFAELDNAELIYLQHGVLWAHMPWRYSYDRVRMDRMVVSTTFESINLSNNYGWPDSTLIKSGVPRFSTFNLKGKSQKRIILCPTWRPYLVGSHTKMGPEPLHDVFTKSDYYQNLMALLSSTELSELLLEYSYTLDVKLHPKFSCYRELFHVENPRISVLESQVDESAYAVAISDYSSYSFDFAYINKAIVYFIPDEDKFRSWYDIYNDVDMPLDDALGEYAPTAKDAIDALRRILDNGGRPLPQYEQKAKSLFFNRDNKQCDRIYRTLMGKRSPKLFFRRS